ncbi:L-lactate utilization operon repressor [Delftia tsuruhatensis]|nr:L-lactate utilization operon repressor [Delftia tsuruhatensis]CAC9675892.1 L-lactate utilization operon repressor [Delftia tsuruhatensis]
MRSDQSGQNLRNAPPPMQSIPTSIAQTLQQHILSGHYASGSQLPPQRELAQQLGISRASLREALSMLETLGLVEIQPGRGVRVNGPHSGSARMHRAYATPALGQLSPRQLIELRLVLEPGWTALAAARADDGGRRQLQWTQDQLAHALARKDLLAAAEADLQFHLLLARLSGNPGLVAMARQLEHAIGHSLRLPFAWSGADDQPALEHGAIARAVCDGDAQAAADAMRAHLLSAARRSGVVLDAPAPATSVSFRLTPPPEGAFA